MGCDFGDVATAKHPENYVIYKPGVSYNMHDKNNCLKECLIIPNYSLKGKMLLELYTLEDGAIKLEGNRLDLN